MRRFINRQEAGRELGAMLHAFRDRDDVIVLGLPRGGVPVAFEVAEALDAPLDVFDPEVRGSEFLYGGDAMPSVIAGHTVILVDDGLATGSTMQAAVAALRAMQPARVIAAVPVASHEAEVTVRCAADRVVCAYVPTRLYDVGLWYEDLPQVTDEQVLKLLRSAPHCPACAAVPAPGHRTP